MVRPEDFRAAARAGATVRTADLIIHMADAGSESARIGLVVPKKQIAHSSHRARVKRRLRHICRDLLPELSPETLLVLRVQAGADGLSSAQLREQLTQGLARARKKLAHKRAGGGIKEVSRNDAAQTVQAEAAGGGEQQA